MQAYPSFEMPSTAGEKGMASFVGKLLAMLEDRRAKEHSFWSSAGDSVVIPDPGQFANHVLPT
jgi:hypothetical protein